MSVKLSLRAMTCLLFCLFLQINTSLEAQENQYPTFMYAVDSVFFPNDEKAAASAITEILKVQSGLDEVALAEIAYWNNAYPGYRWHQIMMDMSQRHKGHKNGGRIAVLHLAIYDAMAATWKRKEEVAQRAPFEIDGRIDRLARARQYSSYICEYSAAAGAASVIIQYYFPIRTGEIDSLLNAFSAARLATGLQYPPDIEKGIAIGRNVAKQYIEYAKTDRTNVKWTGEVPSDPRLWSGSPYAYGPTKRQWRPLTLDRPDQFRPLPPPEDWSSEMEELRQFNATHKTSDIAWKWKSAPIWDNTLERKILEYDLDPFAASYACALFHTARFDAIIAAWDGKYHYWGIRPFQYDPDFKPILVATPNFPGYPAGHTTVAGSLATVLSYLFPRDESEFVEMAWECSESRFEGGVHFRTDNEVGIEVGQEVGKHVIANFTKPER